MYTCLGDSKSSVSEKTQTESVGDASKNSGQEDTKEVESKAPGQGWFL